MDGLDFQEIKKSELENEFTIGAEYYGKKYVESISVVKRQKKTIPLGQMWILATDGDHGSPDYQESGVLYLLSECVKEGYIEKAKCRYITEAKNRELKRSCLHPGDIVVTMLKLQQRNAEAIENGAGSITTECKGFDFSITLGDDFKIATDKETQKEIIEIKLQGS